MSPGAGNPVPPSPGPVRQVIQAYGDGGFRVAGIAHRGSLLVFPQRTLPWGVREADGVDIDSLGDVIAVARAEVTLLLVGCGRTFLPPSEPLRTALRAAGIALEWMDTGAACRTFNVLLQENRPVAAALIAVE